MQEQTKKLFKAWQAQCKAQAGMQLLTMNFFKAWETQEKEGTFYSDIFGHCRYGDGKIAHVKTVKEGWRALDEVYIKDPSASGGYRSVSELRPSEAKKLFSLELFQIQEDKRRIRSGYYGYTAASISPDNEEPVEISAAIVACGDTKLEFSREEWRLLDHIVYKTLPAGSEPIHVNPALLKEGDLLSYTKREDGIKYKHGATYQVVKIYEPNPENKLFRIQALWDETEADVTEKEVGDDCYQVPYRAYQEEYAQFNEMLNENSLKPILMRDGTTYHLHWLPIEEASRYIVSVYKTNTVWGYNKLYFLQDYYVERNVLHIVLEKLIGSNYIFRVSAENREGEIIAKSRGISASGDRPTFWRVSR